MQPELIMPESSDAEKPKMTFALVPIVGCTVIDGGQDTVGGFSSVTERRKLHEDELRLVLSVATHDTSV